MKLRDFLEEEKIFEYSIIPFSEAEIIDQRRRERLFGGKKCQTVVPFLIPYKTEISCTSNISRYAFARDYHFYFDGLTQRLKKHFPELLSGCDTSPVNEVKLAVDAGLGEIGKNGLLINRRYGSFVFVGEFYFSCPTDDGIFEGIERRNTGHFCLMCGACKNACPTDALCDKGKCLSCINQKKKITPEEEKLITRHGIVWGCDACQNACPLNENAELSPIPFFSENLTPFLTDELVDSMKESGELDLRAYAWRGEAVLRRNIALCKSKNAPT